MLEGEVKAGWDEGRLEGGVERGEVRVDGGRGVR